MEFHGLKGSKKNWGGLRSSYNPKLAITIKVLEHLKKYLKLMPRFKLFVVPFLISPHPFSVCGIPIASLSPLPNRQVLLCSPRHSQNNYCIIYALSSQWPHLTVHPHASGCSRVPLVIKDSAFYSADSNPGPSKRKQDDKGPQWELHLSYVCGLSLSEATAGYSENSQPEGKETCPSV